MAKLTIEVAAEDLEKAMQNAYQKAKGRISIPGFRKGKAPRKMIEQMYGKGIFLEDAANALIPEHYSKALEECDLEIVSQPEIDVTQAEPGKAFIFTAEVAVKPEVTLGDYKGVEVPKSEIEVTDEEVDAEVKNYESQEYFDLKQSKRLDRSSQFAIIASREAFKDSEINAENTDLTKMGVVLGSGIGGLGTIEKENKIMLEKGPDRVSPMYIPMSIVNMAAGNVAIDLGIKGESYCAVTACASGIRASGIPKN